MVSLPSHGERTKAAIIDRGLVLWRETKQPVTARSVGRALGLTHAAVLYHFKSVAGLQEAVASEAVRRGDVEIVPMLIAARHPAAAALPDDVRRSFMNGCG